MGYYICLKNIWNDTTMEEFLEKWHETLELNIFTTITFSPLRHLDFPQCHAF